MNSRTLNIDEITADGDLVNFSQVTAVKLGSVSCTGDRASGCLWFIIRHPVAARSPDQRVHGRGGVPAVHRSVELCVGSEAGRRRKSGRQRRCGGRAGWACEAVGRDGVEPEVIRKEKTGDVCGK
eukprot:gene24758-29916_t